MALQTSGAISLSQIAAHFGGSGSHSLSEYHALSGKGVSGIPSSGSISFSHFHGKSNQVTTSVWVSSGSNQTTFQYIGTVRGKNHTEANPSWWMSSTRWDMVTVNLGLNSLGLAYASASRSNVNANNVTSLYEGTRRYSRGTYRSAPKTNKYYDLIIWDNVTTWVDTSGYQNQTTTAQITT